MAFPLNKDALFKQHFLAEVGQLYDRLKIDFCQEERSDQGKPQRVAHEGDRQPAFSDKPNITNGHTILNPTDGELSPVAHSVDAHISIPCTTTVENNADALNPEPTTIAPSPLLQPEPSENENSSSTTEPKLTKGERKKIRALEDRCKSLEDKLGKKDRELKTLQHERNVAQNETKEVKVHLERSVLEHSGALKQTKATLEANFHERYGKLQNAKGTNEDLAKVKEELQRTQDALDKMKEKNKELRGSMHNLKEEHKKRETELDREVKKLRSKMTEMTTRIDISLLPQIDRLKNPSRKGPGIEDLLRTRIRGLERETKDAKKEKERLKPLLEVGIAIRVRFLEQSRQALRDQDVWAINQQSIREGNQAAHSANGTADANLFTTGILTETLESGGKSELAEVFKILYCMLPEGFLESPELLRRATDCEATMSIFKKVRNGRETSRLRKQHGELCEKLNGRWNGYIHCKFPFFEKDLRNWYMLDRLKWLTVEIVEFDRQKNGSGHLSNLSSAFREEESYDSDDDRGFGGFGWVVFADSDLEVSTSDSELYSTFRLGLVQEE